MSPPSLSQGSVDMLLSVTRVQTLQGGRALSSASGFYFRCEGRLFLVTSRHVFCDPASRHQPDRVEVTCHLDAADLRCGQPIGLALYGPDGALWRQAQDAGGEIDVAVLEIPAGSLPRQHALHSFSPAELGDPQQVCDVGDLLAIPSFPLGFGDTVHQLPVVRSAAIASAYGIRFQRQGLFLTDGRTHRGSSGAPVLRRAPDSPGEPRWRLLGVHSSRMDMSGRDLLQDEALGLNCAWYADVLMVLTQPARARA